MVQTTGVALVRLHAPVDLSVAEVLVRAHRTRELRGSGLAADVASTLVDQQMLGWSAMVAAQPRLDGWLARADDVAVGCVLLAGTDTETRVLWIGVDPRHRGTGIGRMLIEAALAGADATGTPVALRVDPHNAAAIALYHSAGFAPTGTDHDLHLARPVRGVSR